MTSGPIPAGSPRATASGLSAGSAIVDHRVAPQIAQVALRPAVDPLLLHLGRDLGRIGGAGAGRIVASAQDEDADPLLRAERRRRLADAEAQEHLLKRRRQVADPDLVVGDELGAER